MRLLDNPPLFVVFEGHNGAGKTTVMSQVAEELREQGLRVATFRDPGGCETGEAVRSILKGFKPLLASMPPKDSTYIRRHLHCAARRALVVEMMGRAAEADVVLCDRWYLSSFVYNTEHGLEPRAEYQPAECHDILSSVCWDARLVFPDMVLLMEEESVTGRDKEKRAYQGFWHVGLAAITDGSLFFRQQTPGIIVNMRLNEHKLKSLQGSGSDWEELSARAGLRSMLDSGVSPARAVSMLIQTLEASQPVVKKVEETV